MNFTSPEAQQRAAEAVKAVEGHTSAEVVIAVRVESDNYRHSDYLFGFVCALLFLSALLYLPQPFDIATWPLDVAVAFVAGVFVCANVPPLRRLLASSKRMDHAVIRAARAEFFTQGLRRTRESSGLLLYVSLFEQRVEAVADDGVEDVLRGETCSATVALMQGAVKKADFTAFLEALEQLGPVLGAALPRRADDLNELDDEPVVS